MQHFGVHNLLFVYYQIPSVLPSQVSDLKIFRYLYIKNIFIRTQINTNIVGSESLVRVAEDGKLDEDVDGEDAPDEDDQLEGGVEGGAGGQLAEEVVNV